jgi:S-adenosylmethionine decarboxylase proenzyme
MSPHPTERKQKALTGTGSDSPVEHEASGIHLLLTLRDCDPSLLNDHARLRELTREAAEATGATVLEICSHQFSPQGITSLAVLAESHASLHTYPESSVVFWDIFTCGSVCKPELSIDLLVNALKPKTITKRLISRN